jgi:uncharacterized protein YycO
MWKLLLGGPLAAIAEVAIAATKNKVYPEMGSIVYCDLALGYAEHSGVHVGAGQIIHLNGKGEIEMVSVEDFVVGNSKTVYVSSANGEAVGSDAAVDRAWEMLGKKRDYNFLIDNCHQFSSGCLNGDFEYHLNFLWMLKDEAKKTIGATEWLLWDR